MNLSSNQAFLVTVVLVAGLIVLMAISKVTWAEAGPLLGALGGGHLVANVAPPAK